ncbi:MAG: GNAT family N-acetyltransferase [Nitrosopumilaceae archaeon]
MDFVAEISDSVDEQEWIDKLESNPETTAYQIPYWLRIYQQSFHSQPMFISVKNRYNEIVCQLAALIHENYYWKDTNIISKAIGTTLNLNKTLNWVYGPIIHDKTYQEQILQKILNVLEEIAVRSNVTMIRGSSPPLSNPFSEKIFEKYGYKTQQWATYIIDLQQKPEEFYSNLDKKTRYDIRKAEENELEFEIVRNRSGFNEFEEFVVNAKIRSGEKRKKHHLFFEKLWKNLYERDYHKVFLARFKEELLGAIDVSIFNGNIVQWGVANSPKKEFSSGTFLTWNAIKWSMENRYLTFDMGGVNPLPEDEKEKRINFYKSKWGGKKRNYIWYTKIMSKTKVQLSSALKNPKSITKKFKRIYTK